MTRFAWTFAGLANQGVTTGTPTGVGPSFATAGDVPSLEMPAYPQNFTNICTIQTLPRHLVFPLMGLNFFIQQIGQEAVELHMNESVLTCVVDFVLLDVSSWVPQNSWSDCSWSGQIWPDGVELGLQDLFRRSSKLWKKSWAKKRRSVTGWDAVGTRMPCLARSRRIFARWKVCAIPSVARVPSMNSIKMRQNASMPNGWKISSLEHCQPARSVSFRAASAQNDLAQEPSLQAVHLYSYMRGIHTAL